MFLLVNKWEKLILLEQNRQKIAVDAKAAEAATTQASIDEKTNVLITVTVDGDEVEKKLKELAEMPEEVLAEAQAESGENKEELEKILEELTVQEAALNADITNLTAAKTTLDTEVQTLAAAKAALDNEFAELTAAKDVLEQQLAELTAAKDVLEQQLAELTAVKAAVDAETTGLIEQHTTVTQELEALNGEQETVTGEIAVLNEQKVMLEAKKTELEDTKVSLEELIVEAEETVTSETTEPETTAPETAAPETTVPETTTPETIVTEIVMEGSLDEVIELNETQASESEKEKSAEELYKEKAEELYNAIISDTGYAWIDQLWMDIYANAGMKWNEPYTASDLEKAFVDYFMAYSGETNPQAVKNGEFMDIFYLSIGKLRYSDHHGSYYAATKGARAAAACNNLKSMQQVRHVYMIGFDGYAGRQPGMENASSTTDFSWMNPNAVEGFEYNNKVQEPAVRVTADKCTYSSSSNFSGVLAQLPAISDTLITTKYNNTYVSDYMYMTLTVRACLCRSKPLHIGRRCVPASLTAAAQNQCFAVSSLILPLKKVCRLSFS